MMRSIVIYYSYTGNTEKVAQILAEYLREKNEVEIFRLDAEESPYFFIQAMRAFRHKKAKLKSINFDLRNYDLICFGSPVWAFSPAPAMNTYLEKCFGLEEKSVVLFCTHGSGIGKERCLDYMQEVLSKKKVKDFRRFSIQQFMVDNKEFILSQIKQILEK